MPNSQDNMDKMHYSDADFAAGELAYHAGLMFLYGQGVSVNLAEAKTLLQLAHEHGHEEAQSKLALIK